LREANLRGADLCGANLRGANLREANLCGADLREATYSIFVLLRSCWNSVSDGLCLEMMRWDAISCGMKKMDAWKNTGECPFSGSEREFYFQERKELWVPGAPVMNHLQLFKALCKEKEIKL
jgi:hypothetical protein